MAQARNWRRILGRLLRHRWLDESDVAKAVPPDLLDRLKRRVAASENATAVRSVSTWRLACP